MSEVREPRFLMQNLRVRYNVEGKQVAIAVPKDDSEGTTLFGILTLRGSTLENACVDGCSFVKDLEFGEAN